MLVFQAASEVIGATQLACNVTADCNHPAAVCVPTSALPGVGYCAPQAPTAKIKNVCYTGMHASCEELITATAGIGIGVVVWGIGYKLF
tara:strand:- start:160 stop:426 length:267 start_codon:yes stop_codon:yes gene_type:complete